MDRSASPKRRHERTSSSPWPPSPATRPNGSWPDRRWEWVVYAEGDDDCERDFLHLSVRERWFYQATIETAKMFMHTEGADSIYMLAASDADGAPLDGANDYELVVPAPVPAAQFWSVTLYDLDTGSEIDTSQFKPVITSLRDDLTPMTTATSPWPSAPTSPPTPPPGSRPTSGANGSLDGTWRPADLRRA